MQSRGAAKQSRGAEQRRKTERQSRGAKQRSQAEEQAEEEEEQEEVAQEQAEEEEGKGRRPCSGGIFFTAYHITNPEHIRFIRFLWP